MLNPLSTCYVGGITTFFFFLYERDIYLKKHVPHITQGFMSQLLMLLFLNCTWLVAVIQHLGDGGDINNSLWHLNVFIRAAFR